MLANRSVTSLVSYHKLSMADNIWAGLRLGQCTSGFGGGGGGGVGGGGGGGGGGRG